MRQLFPILLLVVTAGCTQPDEPSVGLAGESEAAPPEQEAAQPAETVSASGDLAGTAWQLVELQSMDDAVGVTRPDDPSQYTMTLNEDGTASLQLNCNRGTGAWSAEPAGDDSGSFSLGPLAVTRALCPPGSLDERIAREAEFIRSYLMQDGRLNLSLMADGGIQVWEPLAQ